jgi:hypothetical protein
LGVELSQGRWTGSLKVGDPIKKVIAGGTAAHAFGNGMFEILREYKKMIDMLHCGMIEISSSVSLCA